MMMPASGAFHRARINPTERINVLLVEIAKFEFTNL
jgi:hypothetical protein